MKRNKVAVTSFAVSTVVGAGCYAGAAALGVATGGAGVAVACGAIAGAVAGAVEYAMDSEANKSLVGYGKAMLFTTGFGTGVSYRRPAVEVDRTKSLTQDVVRLAA